MNEDNQVWRVKTVRGGVFTVRTVLAIAPTRVGESWSARASGQSETVFARHPRGAVLLLASSLGWDAVEIAAPGEKLASESADAIRHLFHLFLASTIAHKLSDEASERAIDAHCAARDSGCSEDLIDARDAADHAAEEVHRASEEAEEAFAAQLAEVTADLSPDGSAMSSMRLLLALGGTGPR